MSKIGVGVVGCGVISDIYLKNLTSTFSHIVDVVATADIIPERAEERAQKYSVPKHYPSTEDMLKGSGKDIQLVVNLTTPDAHAVVDFTAIEAGKSAYVEKPFTITREDGLKKLRLAKEKGVLCGGAPDTFLGGGLQTCRKLIDDGWIGEPVAATAFMTGHGHESWHPAPAFYYQVGAGPMFDMGPYYLTALVNLVGPIESVSGTARKTFDKRLITSEPLKGTIIDVQVPTHIAGVINFKNGAVGTIITSFDIWGAELPRIEIYGSKGSLSVPDPNTFGGPIKLRRPGSKEWESVPVLADYQENSRGLGVADMALAILNKAKPRANGEQAYHVLDAMHAFHDASDQGRTVKLESTCARSEALPLGKL